MIFTPYSDELAATLLELENDLSRDHFFGVPMGSTLATPFILEFWNGRGRWSRKQRWQLRAQRLARYLRPSGNLSNIELAARSDLPKHPILVTWLRDDPRYNGLVEPVLEHLPVGETVLLAREFNKSLGRDQHPRLPLIAPPPPDMRAWRAEYMRVSPSWARTLRSYVRKHDLPRESLPFLHTMLLHQSQRVTGYLAMLEALQPRAILTEFDRNRNASCLILAAIHHGVPTATLVHGTINPPYGYNPVLADRILVWGEVQRRQLLDLGTDPDKIRLTGFARVQRSEPRDTASIKQSVGLSPAKPVVMLATNPIEVSARELLIATYCDAFAGRDDLNIIVRTHPAEGENAWGKEYRERYPYVRAFGRGDQTVEDALAMTDVFVCNNTGMSMDALLHDTPVVLLDVPGSSLLSNQELADEGAAEVATTPETLVGAVETVLKAGKIADRLKEKREAYIKSMYHATGDDAAVNTAKELLEMAGGSIKTVNFGNDNA